MNHQFVLLECSISILAMLATWLLLFEPLRRDNFRSQVRHLRDNLFDYMWQKRFSFSDPAYQKERRSLNNLIAYAGTISPSTFILASIIAVRHYRDFPSIATEEQPVTNAELAKKLGETQTAAVGLTLNFLFLGGLCGLVFRPLLQLLRLTHHLIWLTRQVQRVKVAILSGAELMVSRILTLECNDLHAAGKN